MNACMTCHFNQREDLLQKTKFLTNTRNDKKKCFVSFFAPRGDESHHFYKRLI
jgi:hypothetical protein